jgi:hypothetical protein
MLSTGLIVAALAPVAISVGVATPASAECDNAGNATVCAQGTVRSGGPTPPSGVVYPGYCYNSWYCGDDWGIDISLPPIRPGRPGGIGPR